MKTIKLLIFLCIAAAGTAVAQTTTNPGQSVPQTVPQGNPVPTISDDNRKTTDLNAPQTPSRPAQIPSEDTLIKGQRSSSMVIHDSLTPSVDKKANRGKDKNRKGTAETDDSTSTQNSTQSAIKP